MREVKETGMVKKPETGDAIGFFTFPARPDGESRVPARKSQKANRVLVNVVISGKPGFERSGIARKDVELSASVAPVVCKP
jgi:hypothetical protein